MTLSELRRWARTTLIETLGISSTESVACEVDYILTVLLACTRADLILSLEQKADAATRERLEHIIERRCADEPLAYILGKTDFYSVDLVVTPDVLIPRPETEVLVEAVLKSFKSKHGNFFLIDLGTGSGAIVLTLLHELRRAYGTEYLRKGLSVALDKSVEALKVARTNAIRLELDSYVHFIKGDLLRTIRPATGYEQTVITANLPYVAESERLPRSVEAYEPMLALCGGVDGLDLIRALAQQFASWAKQRRGAQVSLFLEIGDKQRAAVECLLAEMGLHNTEVFQDLHQIARVVRVVTD